MKSNRWVKLYISVDNQVLVRLIPIGKSDYKIEESVVLDGELHKRSTKKGILEDITKRFDSYGRDDSLKFIKFVQG